MITTVAGKLVGKSNDVVVRYDKGKNAVVKEISIQGRYVYIKKCKKEETSGGILLCEKSRNDTPIAVVLGLGKECGKFHVLSKNDKAKGIVPQVEWPEDSIGKRVLCPDESDFIKESPFDENEKLIHECAIKAILD